MGKETKGQITIDNPSVEQLDALIKRSTISVTEYQQHYNLMKETLEQKMVGQSQWSDRELAELLHKATDKFDVPPENLWVGDSTIATFVNFSASTGKAKSRKTFNVSAIVAASLINGAVLKYRACLPHKQRKVLYFDTEQSRYHCHNVLTRILRLAKQPLDQDLKT